MYNVTHLLRNREYGKCNIVTTLQKPHIKRNEMLTLRTYIKQLFSGKLRSIHEQFSSAPLQCDCEEILCYRDTIEEGHSCVLCKTQIQTQRTKCILCDEIKGHNCTCLFTLHRCNVCTQLKSVVKESSILYYINLGLTRYHYESVTMNYSIHNNVHSFENFTLYQATEVSLYATMIITHTFQLQQQQYVSTYKTYVPENPLRHITIPQHELKLQLTLQEEMYCNTLRTEPEHIISLLFLYMLGTQELNICKLIHENML